MSKLDEFHKAAQTLSNMAEERIRELEAEKVTIQEEITALRGYVRKGKAVMSNGRTQHSKPKAKKSQNASADSVRIAAREIMTYFSEIPFSQNQLAARVGMHPSTIGKIVRELRGKEAIRLAERKRINGNNMGLPTQFYRVDQLARLRAIAHA